MKLWIKLQHWFYRMLIDYKTKKIVEFNKERENYLKTNNMKLWIARDSYGLWLFDNKPIKVIINGDKCCKTTEGNRYNLDDELFPKITFENSPMLAEIELVEEE